MTVVGAQAEGHLTLTQIGSIRENLQTDAEMGGASKMDLCLDLDTILY